MKNIRKYIKTYEQQRMEKGYWCDNGISYRPINWDEFEKLNYYTFNQYFNKKYDDEHRRINLFIKLLIEDFNYLGYYMAFHEPKNFAFLNNVIFQTSYNKLLYIGCVGTGTDFTITLMDIMYALACNHMEVIKLFLPEELSCQKLQYYSQYCVSLIRAMFYKKQNLKDIIEKTSVYLQKRKRLTGWERSATSYFLALAQNNAELASIALNDFCKAYKRQGFPVDKLDKCFAVEAHGMYRFAKIINENLFHQIQMPNSDCFFIEFEQWQRKNQYPKGKFAYFYPQYLNEVNDILNAGLPKISQSQSNDGWTKDSDKFCSDLIQRIARLR